MAAQVVKEEGWGRLYGGLTPSLAGTAASQVRTRLYLVIKTKDSYAYKTKD